MAGDLELPPADILALTLSEAAADEHGEAAAEGYLASFLDELFELEPALRQHFVGLVLTDLVEAVAQEEDPRHARAVVQLIEDIKARWEQGA